ncbi:protein kinase PKH3 Ecym_4523 [Eremothecium cymbalariae DBVPG|uniref:non-specific serine/threonine protein kinase n=1 Tax=Eremothecium cymbalariae (strain CBS 270.75 / DBVPG 7215 / KCTC 17166 / NRRL Y-17582) TaxID=931890 RepID=G8JU57_ERECY|nr:hypothetical protein Ecym_4523 [Eremothecium cymbalariae DBVPG\
MSRKSPQDFIFREELGHGSYSTVYRVTDKSNQHPYAIKICSKKHIIGENKVKYVTIEKNTLNVLGRANHPGIIKLYYTFHDLENLYFVLDLAPGGELLQLLRRYGTFSETWARHFMCQLLDTVEYIHSMSVIHRDLKPENVLLDKEGRLMITDFGAACTLEGPAGALAAGSEGVEAKETSATSFVGTAEYVSPELLLKNKCYHSSDIWALGCMMFQFMQGTPPFRGNNELETFEKIVRLDYRWRSQVNPLIVDLVSKILVLDSAQRYSIDQIKQHRWFAGIDWTDKDRIWRGVWKLPQPINGTRQAMKQRSLDPPLNNIPVAIQRKKKHTKINTTSSIVQWRKMLGLNDSSINPKSPLGTNGLPQPHTPTSAAVMMDPNPKMSSIHRSPSKPVVRSGSSTVLRNGLNPPRPEATAVPVVTPHKPLQKSPASCSTTIVPPDNVMKQDWVEIYEMKYDPNVKNLTFDSFSEVNDSLIQKFIYGQSSELHSVSKLCLLWVDNSGNLSYVYKNAVYPISYIADPHLSVYNYQFTTAKNEGYLILEKYRQKLWVIFFRNNLPPGAGNISANEQWSECFLKFKNNLDENELSNRLRKASVSSGRSTRSTPSKKENIFSEATIGFTPPSSAPSIKENPIPLPKGKIVVKQNVNSNKQIKVKSDVNKMQRNGYKCNQADDMVLSSSRYEVLNAVKHDNTKKGVATSGASAAFKNLRVNDRQ